MKFGEFLKELRERNGVGLHQYAREINMDHGQYCKIESSTLPPPNSKVKVMGLIRKLVLSRHEINDLVDLAKDYHVEKAVGRFK